MAGLAAARREAHLALRLAACAAAARVAGAAPTAPAYLADLEGRLAPARRRPIGAGASALAAGRVLPVDEALAEAAAFLAGLRPDPPPHRAVPGREDSGIAVSPGH